MSCSMIPKIIKTGFAAIHLIYFFTAGPDEVLVLSLQQNLSYPDTDTRISIEADTDTPIRHFPKKLRYVDTFQIFLKK